MSDLKSVSTGTPVLAASKSFVVPTVVAPTQGTIVFDNFSTGDFSHTQNGFAWKGGGNNAPSISADNPKSGTHSMKIRYDGAAPTNGGNTQKNFKFGGDYREFYINFDLYIPNGNEPWGGARYKRENNKNHKFLRAWCNKPGQSNQDGYSNDDTMGAQTRGTAGSSTSFSANIDLDHHKTDNSNSIGETGGGQIIADSDAGKWINVQMFFKQTTGLGHSNGEMRWWKNGLLKKTLTGLDGWADNGNHLFNEAYIFGAANGGFAQETILFMDNFSLSTESTF